jgi:DNA-binding response OmpR family regulator
MKRLLLVDDDAVVLRSYRDRLSAHGFQVNTAADGTAALGILRSGKPDLVVLDLMMPNLSGVDVLRFIRATPRLAATPVVVLTNAYLNELGREAAKIGIDRALLKAQCSPSVLMSVIDEIFQAKAQPASVDAAENTSQAEAPPGAGMAGATPAAPPVPERASVPTPKPPAPVPAPVTTAQAAEAERVSLSPEQSTAMLLARGPAFCGELRKLFQALSRETELSQGRALRLQEVYRKLHSLVGMVALTPYGQISQMAAVFEALLFVLVEKPARLTPSVVRTIANLVDFMELLFQQAPKTAPGPAVTARALAVDDDPFSNRLVLSALRQANLEARSTEKALIAWDWLQKEPFDLLLLDIEMPELDGFELCKRFRALPGREKVPVIFITGHTDFANRAKSTLSGGDDLISKPILPMELAAKAVMHLLKRQMAS